MDKLLQRNLHCSTELLKLSRRVALFPFLGSQRYGVMCDHLNCPLICTIAAPCDRIFLYSSLLGLRLTAMQINDKEAIRGIIDKTLEKI